MARSIKHLADDIERAFEIGRAEAAANVVYSLQFLGPWWTGTFGRNWKVSDKPLFPTKTYQGRGNNVNGPVPTRTPRRARRPVPIPTALSRTLYVVNNVNYAGFAVNARGAIVPVGNPSGITYGQHALRHRITAKLGVMWFPMYITHEKYFLKDLNKGFTSGFSKAMGAQPSMLGPHSTGLSVRRGVADKAGLG